MSLLDEFKKEYCLMEKTRVPDGEGGFITSWSDGITIELIEQHNQTMLNTNNGRVQLDSVYRFFCNKEMVFSVNDFIKRLSDGQIYRVTKPSKEDYTPASSSLNLTYFEAEKGELPL